MATRRSNSFPESLFPLGQKVESIRVEVSKKDTSLFGMYLGRAAEHRVVSELLFLGFNASVMSVDEGSDVVATKKRKLYNIQVKTGKRYPGKQYVFVFPTNTFEKHSKENTFYVFVLRTEQQIRFLIFPYRWIRQQIKVGGIRLVREEKYYRMTVRESGEALFLNNKKHPISEHEDNWSSIN